MIWLASFPRSGNTFFRNVLYEVYGLESSTFHHEKGYFLDPKYASYPFVKTHLLPSQLIPNDATIPKVYLVRDGRDALISLAHHRKDIVEPGTDFEVNLLEAILAADGSYFGGWSENVKQWTQVADIVIRYEDLIQDPIKEVEKLRKIIDLPPPQIEKLPTFESLKFGNPQYGSGVNLKVRPDNPEELAAKNFRKGKKGGWKQEMSQPYQELFYELHGEVLRELGYEAPFLKESIKKRILLEGAKAMDDKMDGIKRYCEELFTSLNHLSKLREDYWEFDVLIGKSIIPLNDFVWSIYERKDQEKIQLDMSTMGKQLEYENRLLSFKAYLQQNLPKGFYPFLRKIYVNLPFRQMLASWRSFLVYRSFRKHIHTVNQRYDLIHVLLPQNYKYVSRFKSKIVFTIHDMTHQIFSEFHLPSNVQLAQKGISFIKKKSIGVVCVSECTQKDFIQHVDQVPSTMIYEAANHHFLNALNHRESQISTLKKYKIEDKPYFLCLFTLEPRKNIVNTVHAFIQFKALTGNENFQLVICGARGWKDQFLNELIDKNEESIRFTGYVEEADIQIMYKCAYAFCYLPFYEGFGLPALEALQQGTPVLSSNNSSLPEVVGDAGLYADPHDIDDIVQKMQMISNDRDKYEELKKNTFKQSRKFSWVKTAFETMNFYEQMVKL
jgi:glycosyltransferase involved in cell wall biosynthesis